MDNNSGIFIAKKIIQKGLINELVSKGLADFVNISNVIKKLDEEISKLKELQEKDKDVKNIIVKILV